MRKEERGRKKDRQMSCRMLSFQFLISDFRGVEIKKQKEEILLNLVSYVKFRFPGYQGGEGRKQKAKRSLNVLSYVKFLISYF